MDFRLLGPLEVRADGRPLPLGGPKQRAVLAMLLLHAGEVVSTDRLIDEIWGERPPKTVHAYIQNCISRLRPVLGRELIEMRPPGYVLWADEKSIDAVRFADAVAAAPALEPPERAAHSVRRGSACGVARRLPTSRSRRFRRARSPGSRSCGSSRSRSGSRPSWSSAARRRSSAR